MIKIIKDSYPYYIMQDTNKIEQYAVMVRTGADFYQQISPWYLRKGNAIKRYNKILQQKTKEFLNIC